MRALVMNGTVSRPDRLTPARGFTVMELLVTITLSGVVVSSMVAFFISQAKTSRLAGTRIEAVQRARFASELLRREMSLAGAGIPSAQPFVVYAGPNHLVFSVDLASSTPGDRIAVYQLPHAPLTETEGADSGTVVLPNSEIYPLRWYGGDRLPGPAETIRFSFVPEGFGRYSLIKAVNDLPGDTLLRGLDQVGDRDFFSYQAVDAAGGVRPITALPIWHEAPIHGSEADSAGSALTDSVKLVQVAFKLKVKGRLNQVVERNFSMAISLKNAGLIQNASCGEAPLLGVVPAAAIIDLDPIRVQVSWSPALDERSGEEDVRQYNLYRREVGETSARPIASLPPDPDLPGYNYIDADLEAGKTYTYLLGATDCTPTSSDVAESPPITIPGA